MFTYNATVPFFLPEDISMDLIFVVKINETLRRSDKMLGEPKPRILSLFRNSFKKFNKA